MTSTLGYLVSKAGATVTIYTDSACTILADIQSENGAPIPGSRLVVAPDGRIPKFLGPDGTPNGPDQLYALVQGNTPPGEPIYSRYDDRLDSDTFTRCTNITRPAAPTADQIIYETDTDKFLRWDAGSSLWLTVKKKYAPNVVEVTTNSAAFSAETTLATSNVLAADGVTAFDILGAWSAFTSTIATDQFAYRLYEDSTLIAQCNRYAQSTAAQAGDGGTVTKRGRVPAAGNHTYTLRAARITGTGTMTNLASATTPTVIDVREAS